MRTDRCWRRGATVVAFLLINGCGGTSAECPGGCPEGESCFYGTCVPSIDGGDADGNDALDAPDDVGGDVEGDGSEESASYCGNGVVEPSEECDDGNPAPHDGCEPDCRFTCRLPANCDDGNTCNGTENCAAHACIGGTPPPEGSPCRTSAGGEGICREGLCAPSSCGNDRVEAGEECDDGNVDNRDGCLTNCLFARCGDGYVHEGVEVCDGDEPRPCTTTCGSLGARSCVDCVWEVGCAPPLDVCNGDDDDCDGTTDDGFPCPVGTVAPCTTTCGSTGRSTTARRPAAT